MSSTTSSRLASQTQSSDVKKMPNLTKKQTGAVEKELDKGTDEGRMRAVDLLRSFEKEVLPVSKSYTTELLANGKIVVDEADQCNVMSRKTKYGWYCSSATRCEAGFTGVLLSDDTLYAFCRKTHNHGPNRYPLKDYNNVTGRLRELDHLINIIGAGGDFDKYTRAMQTLDDALFKLTGADGEGIVYLKLSATLPSWTIEDVIESVEYIGSTTMSLDRRFTQHSRTNLMQFTDNGTVFYVLYIRVAKPALEVIEKLFHRLFAHSPYLLNKQSGPIDLPGVSRLDEQQGASLKFLSAISQAGVKEVDWTQKRHEEEQKRARAEDGRSDTSSLSESDGEWPQYTELKRREEEKRAELKSILDEERRIRRRSAEARKTQKRPRDEADSEVHHDVKRVRGEADSDQM